MRVIYFSSAYTPHDHRFLSALATTSHKVFYLRLEGEARESEGRPVPASIEQLSWAGGRGRFSWGAVPRLVLDLRRVIRETQPDLIHAGPIQTCAFLSVLSGFRPILAMSWGFDLMQDADRSAWWRWVTRYTLARSTFFTSDARVTRDRAIAFGMNPDRTLIFPWGVDLKLFAPDPPRRIARHSESRKGSSRRRAASAGGHRRTDGLVLFCNRSWEPRYGVDVLAQAFAKAARQNPRISLILLGGGSQAQRIRQTLADGNVMTRVVFGGQVPHADLPRWYRMADIFVSPSHVDGSSVSLMEALACGLPALVSDIPANKEWVHENLNGWLFADGDVDGLAQRILDLAANRGGFVRTRQAARASAEQRADWSRNFPVLLQAYERALRQH
jgi:glycosyltransferase involved in cell wall biosynthesis